MIEFLWRKIWKNKWLMLCLIFGNIILVGMASVVPLFTSATTQRLLQEELRNVQETQNTFPAILELRYNFHAVQETRRFDAYLATRSTLWPDAVQNIDIPRVFGVRTYTVRGFRLRPVVAREIQNKDRTLSLVAPESFEDHIHLLHGRMPSQELVRNEYSDGYIIEVLALDAVMHLHNLLLGELLYFPQTGDEDGGRLYAKVVGIFGLDEDSNAYWSVVPITFESSLLFSNRLINRNFVEEHVVDFTLFVTLTQVLDATAMRANYVPRYIETIHEALEFFNVGNNIWVYSANFYDTINHFAGLPEQLDVTVLILQIPVYVMLALFMYMVTRQILLLDSNDISILKSRGASRRQIMGLYALQGLFVGAVSFPFGLLLSIGLCHVIGSSSGFLEMVGRAALDVEITGQAVLFGLIGIFVSYLYLLLPVIKLSGVAIVDHKRDKVRKSKKPLWQRYFLDVLTLALSIYLLYSFNLQREQMMITMPDARSFDPLLFAGSSLFIIGAALVLLRLYPYFLKLVMFLGHKRFGPALYASVTKVSRSAGGEQFIMLFLVFTAAVGIFSAQAARTLNLNNAHRIQYLGGADIMLREAWEDNFLTEQEMLITGRRQPETLLYTEPDFNRFTHFEEVDAITRVMMRSREASVVHTGLSSTVAGVSFMGIETKSFGETVWFRDDLLMTHINYFLNVLSLHPNGVLLSSNFHTELGYGIGDTVTLTLRQRQGSPLAGRFMIVGFVDYWPSFNPVSITRHFTGEIRQETQSLAVVNLGQIHTNWGVWPYQIWMRTNVDSHQFIYDFISDNGIRTLEFYDSARSLAAILSDPIVQSTNGMLTIVFIMTMLLCFTGFLIYWILSIKGRLLQFGVFRAMGMGMRGIISILISEQVLITISALVIGGVIGGLASRFFVPLVQLSYTAADQVIPLLVAMELRDYFTIYGICGFMLALCVAVLVRYTLRVDVSQVLKLGED